jgi:hypothetical protein
LGFAYVYISGDGKGRCKMKTKTKIAILMVAVLLSLFGFNLITCSDCFMEMLASKDVSYSVTTQVTSVAPNMATVP